MFVSNKTVFNFTLTTLLLVISLAMPAFAQSAREQRDITIDAAMRTQVIDSALRKLNDAYVFPDVARKMEAAIRERVQKNEYDSITSGAKFAQTLTAHLQEVSHDKHLRIGFSDQPIPPDGGRREPSPAERDRFMSDMRRANFGFEKVERLNGNVGYIDLRGFMDADLGGETVVAAMNFLANTEALIIDLRQNGGGSPGMVQLISSYFFGEPTHLNDLYWREGESTQQFWTNAYVPGRRYLKKEIYILTSNRTFSAAEEFTYNLKNLKRAIIVGETTGGGAHPGGPSRINDHFFVGIPRGRAINPITKTNWEGTGVEPDLKVPANLALKTAYAASLVKIIDALPDGQRKTNIKELAASLQREVEEMKKPTKPAAQ